MKQVIAKILKEALKELDVDLKEDEIERYLEIPPSIDMGDYSFPCFFLAETLKYPPHQIAIDLRTKIKNIPLVDFEDVETAGGYVNFFLDRKELARKSVWDVLTKKKNYGKLDWGKRKKIVVEFSNPNIAKPFGIGHLRSTIIGNSIANIFEFVGYKVIRINYFGDWGTQFGKLLFGYENFGNEEKLKENPTSHLLDVYVKANKKKYEAQGQKWFKKLEMRDKKAVMLWRAFRELSLDEFNRVYKILGIEFDEVSGESLSVKKSDAILKELEQKKLLKKSHGAWIVDLKEFGLGVCMMKKSDEGTTYALRDISAAIERYKKYGFYKMIYEVGHEQELHFRQIFKVLEMMGYSWAKKCVHVEHGLYLDEDGKKFSTRKGKTIFLENIINRTIELAKKEIEKRGTKISKKELEDRAMKIAIASIFYGDLKNNRKNDVVFDLKRFVSFEGNTGPYIQYSYARAGSILKKAKTQNKFEILDLDIKEIELVKQILQFPEAVFRSYTSMNPSIIANYSFQISKAFNEFYHACPVIGSEEESFRLALTEAFRQVLRNAFKILGINLVEKM
jgi:arginyl-tRNA synthetase